MLMGLGHRKLVWRSGAALMRDVEQFSPPVRQVPPKEDEDATLNFPLLKWRIIRGSRRLRGRNDEKGDEI